MQEPLKEGADILTCKKLFRSMSDYETIHLLRMSYSCLMDETSWRHQQYLRGSKMQNKLKLLSNSINCVTEQQFELITRDMLQFFDSKIKHSKFQYIVDVLYPEAVIHMLGSKFGLGREEAEQVMYSTCIHHPQSHSHGDDLDTLLLKNEQTLRELRSGRSQLSINSLVRGYTVQKKLRLNDDQAESYEMLCVCAIHKNKSKGYSKASEFVEVRVKHNASYDEVTTAAKDGLCLPHQEGVLRLFRVDGTVIPDGNIVDKPWTIGTYLKTMKKATSQLKLGVGYLLQSSMQLKRKCDPNGTALLQLPAKKRRSNLEVRYAPAIGTSLLDLEEFCSREEAYENNGDFDPDLVKMDEDGPYIPESDCYHVVSIIQDTKVILTTENDGTMKVGDDDENGPFRVIHQTASTEIAEGSVIPLFCVATGHTINYTYKWSTLNQSLIGNTPLMWVNSPGVYRCQVSNKGESCYSANIIVTKENVASGTGGSRNAIGIEDSVIESQGKESEVPENTGRSRDIVGTGVEDSVKSQSKEDKVPEGLMVFNEAEIIAATSNFDNLIGEGGFGTVYRGILRSTSVAVKVLSERGEHLLNEINSLKRFCHVNILPLMGYCLNPPMIVLPFMEKGSFHAGLHVRKDLNAELRIRILRDTARGLTYLHKASPPLVHHDINTSNILINKYGEAKICDFGFSITLPERKKGKTLITAARNLPLPATIGYMPPEYYEGRYSTYSDVYCYGIVVLEAYSGAMAYDESREDHRIIDLYDDERRDIERFKNISDPNAGTFTAEGIRTIFSITQACIQNSYKKRDPIDQVLEKWEALP